MSPMRIRIAQRMKESQNSAATLTTMNEIDLTNLIEMRKKYKDNFGSKHAGTKLGFMSAFVKSSALALQEFPIINARLDMDSAEVIYHDFVDISVAVATPKVCTSDVDGLMM